MAERKITCSDGVDRVPGIYRGDSDPIFGLWRLREDGRWLFCMPVKGSRWRFTDQLPRDEFPMNDVRSMYRHAFPGAYEAMMKMPSFLPVPDQEDGQRAQDS